MQTSIAFASDGAFRLRRVCIDFVAGSAAGMHADVQIGCTSYARPSAVGIPASSHAAVTYGSRLAWPGACSGRGMRRWREQQQDKRGGTQAAVTPCLHGWGHGTRAVPWRAAWARKRLSVLWKLGAMAAGLGLATPEAA